MSKTPVTTTTAGANSSTAQARRKTASIIAEARLERSTHLHWRPVDTPRFHGYRDGRQGRPRACQKIPLGQSRDPATAHRDGFRCGTTANAATPPSPTPFISGSTKGREAAVPLSAKDAHGPLAKTYTEQGLRGVQARQKVSSGFPKTQ